MKLHSCCYHNQKISYIAQVNGINPMVPGGNIIKGNKEMVFMFGITAFILSITAFWVSAIPTILIILSGLFGVFAKGRGLSLGLIAVTINLLHAIFMPVTSFNSDWFTINVGIGWNVVFAILMIFQSLCLGVLLWRWSFPYSEL